MSNLLPSPFDNLAITKTNTLRSYCQIIHFHLSNHFVNPTSLLVVFRFSLLLVGFSLTNSKLFAQNEHQKWFFGRQAGLDFASGSPVAINGSLIQTDEGTSSICDGAGNLLFYTDGQTVYNRNHNIMPSVQATVTMYGSWCIDGTRMPSMPTRSPVPMQMCPRSSVPSFPMSALSMGWMEIPISEQQPKDA
jgi:hypothetical protein